MKNYFLDKKTAGGYKTQDVLSDLDNITYSTVKRLIENCNSLYSFKAFTDLTTAVPTLPSENDVYYPLVVGANIGVDITQEDLDNNVVLRYNSVEFVKENLKGLSEYLYNPLSDNMMEFFYLEDTFFSSWQVELVRDLVNKTLRIYMINVGDQYHFARLFAKESASPWKYEHTYYIAMEIETTEIVNVPSLYMYARTSTAVTVGAFTNIIVPDVGTTAIVTSTATITGDTTDPAVLQLQLGIKSSVGDSLDLTIKNLVCIDMGINESIYTEEELNNFIDDFGIDYVSRVFQDSMFSAKSKHAETADIAIKTQPVADIIGVGDSLMAQNWVQFIGEKTGRNTQAWGYGGKTSAYIRDRFFENLTDENRESTFIFCVGRNNYQETDFIIEDLRDMIDAIGHNRFIILPPPNGNYVGEELDGVNYHRFIELERRQSAEFFSNFFNTRDFVIDGWPMLDINLTASFVQPAVGSTVQIEVSDAVKLNIWNSSDVGSSGRVPEYMNIICVGNKEIYDTYELISVDSDNLITLKLQTAGRIAVGSTVENPLDLLNEARYTLKVFQYVDLYYYDRRVPASTYRKDTIHINDLTLNNLDSRGFLANGVYRFMQTLGY